MKIAIIGTKGIPNRYGGFEAFAEQLSQGLLQHGFSVVVYQPVKSHAKLDDFKGVQRLGVKIPSFLPSNVSRIFYNLFSLRVVKQTMPDMVICCGHSASLFFPFFSKTALRKIIVNLDGLEWKRAKWGVFASYILKLTERLAIKYAGTLVADSIGVRNYVLATYKKQANFIPYGASECEAQPDYQILNLLRVKQQEFALLIARLEPENNIEMAINAAISSGMILVIVGSLTTVHAKKLTKQYGHCPTILFADSIYNLQQLGALRLACKVYIHGHSVGGTNPSLLDAMNAGCLIVAHDNEFNRETLTNGGFYFTSVTELQEKLKIAWNASESTKHNLAILNKDRVANTYTWEAVSEKYVDLIKRQISN